MPRYVVTISRYADPEKVNQIVIAETPGKAKSHVWRNVGDLLGPVTFKDVRAKLAALQAVGEE